MAHISFSVRFSALRRPHEITFYRYWNWDRNPNLAGSQELDLHWNDVADGAPWTDLFTLTSNG